MDQNRKFVLSLYPTAKYYRYLGLVEAAVIENGKHRKYMLGLGKNAKHAWEQAAHHLKMQVLRVLGS